MFPVIDDAETDDLADPVAEEEVASSEREGNFAAANWMCSGFLEGGGGGAFFLRGDLTVEKVSVGGKLVLMEEMAKSANGSSRATALF